MLEWSYNVLKNVSEANSSLYKYIKKEIKIELGQFCKISLFISNNCYCVHKSKEHTILVMINTLKKSIETV